MTHPPNAYNKYFVNKLIVVGLYLCKASFIIDIEGQQLLNYLKIIIESWTMLPHTKPCSMYFMNSR